MERTHSAPYFKIRYLLLTQLIYNIFDVKNLKEVKRAINLSYTIFLDGGPFRPTF